MTRLLLLAVDGLDWPRLQALSATGQLPHCARLAAVGWQARLSLAPAPASDADADADAADDAAADADADVDVDTGAASRWVSWACGVGLAGHGITGDTVCDADGLRLRPPVAADLWAMPLWQRAWQAGLDVRVVGWPATQGAALPATAAAVGSVVVADSFQDAGIPALHAWPLAPDAVAPASARPLVRAARMHPAEVDEALLDAVLPSTLWPPAARMPALRAASARLLARWASVHNLGVHWCSEASAPGGASGPTDAPPQLLMLRLDGLPQWRQTATALAAAHDVPLSDIETPWLAWLDMLLGRYAALMAGSAAGAGQRDGPGVRGVLMLLTDRSADGSEGGVLCSQPVPASDAAAGLRVRGAEEALRTLCEGLGLPDPMGLDQAAMPSTSTSDAMVRLRAAPLQDDAALAWLRAEGQAPVDLVPLYQRAQAVRDAALRALRGEGRQALCPGESAPEPIGPG